MQITRYPPIETNFTREAAVGHSDDCSNGVDIQYLPVFMCLASFVVVRLHATSRRIGSLPREKASPGTTPLFFRCSRHASIMPRQNMVVRIQGKTQQERHGIIAAASDAIGEAGGYILDFKQFSNLAVVFTIELPPSGFAKLRVKLAGLGVILEPPSNEERALLGAAASGEVPGSLRLDFQHQEPDLRIPIPAVPG